MIEVYRDTTEQVEFKLFVGGLQVNSVEPVTVTLEDEAGVAIVPTGPASVMTTNGIETYSYILPVSSTTEERVLRVVWNYTIGGESAQRVEYIKVVTPYATPSEIIDAYPSLDARTYEEIKDRERLARMTIDAFCGQSFNKRHGTEPATAMGNRLYTRNRLISIDANGIAGPLGYTYDPSQWNLVIMPGSRIIVPLNDTHGIKFDLLNSSRNLFEEGTQYFVTGWFGWDHVPSEINLAAKMLVNDYFCNENNWRQKGISAVRAADWRFEYSDRAGEGTGNLDVDRLLDAHRVSGIIIL